MSNSKRGLGKIKILILLVLIAAVLGSAGFVYHKKTSKSQTIDLKTAPRAKVEQGDLVVTILQAGELAARDSKAIVNDTDRQRKITFVVDDGTKVKKGDLLVELDSADLKDEFMKIEGALSKAEADLRQATEQIEINKAKYNSDLKTAQMKLDLANLDLKKYIDAEFPQLVREKEIEISLAKEELQSEKGKLEWTKKLAEKGYANRQDLEKDQLAVNRKVLDLQKSEEDLRILKEFTHTKDLREKNNEVATAKSDLERVKKTYASQSAQDAANLDASKRSLELTKKEAAKKQEEIDRTHIVSEYEGQVFYPKMNPWRDDKIEKGGTVYGRMKILEFPDLSAWQIKTSVPESIIEKVKTGQEAVATIDAISNKTLSAKVAKIGAVPDQAFMWDANQKAYPVTLDVLTSSTNLKPGMSLMVEIITNRLTNITKVPLQAITSESGKQYVYLINKNKVNRTEVKTGESNESFIQVLSGLKPGDEVLLYAPIQADTHVKMKDRPLEKANGKDSRKGSEKESSSKDNSETATGAGSQAEK